MRVAWLGLLVSMAWAAACGDDAPRPTDAGGEADTSIDTGCEDCCTDHAACNNGVYCDGVEACVGSRCVAGAAVVCDDDIACTSDSCDEEHSQCAFTPVDADGDGHAAVTCVDADGDPFGDDCDDGDPDRFPGNVERCDPATDNANVDEDCDARTFGEVDLDGDGAVDDRCVNVGADGVEHRGYDCDDQNMARRRGQQEFCDQRDNDCDSTVDEDPGVVAWYADDDEDGVGGSTLVTETCTLQPNLSLRSNDCDDGEPARRPGFPEFCDGLDNNCNDVIDERLANCAGSQPQTNATINECFNGLSNCALGAICTDLMVGFSCACGPGYMGDGLTCTDVVECAENNGGCDPLATCVEGTGTPRACICPSGYDSSDNGMTCDDIDECATNNGGCGDVARVTCFNNLGAAVTCNDVDECATDHGGCDALYFSCANHFAAPPTCNDIDECATDHGGCDPLASCTNNVGAAPTCGACPSGYRGDGYSGCVVIPRSCLDVRDTGVTTSGSYEIDPDGAGSIAPFSVHCDLTHDGGGWTLIRRNSGGTNTSVEGLPTPTNNVHLSTARMMALAAVSRQVHIRTAGNASDAITSLPDTTPIIRMRQGLSMYDPAVGPPTWTVNASADWTGVASYVDNLWYSCTAELGAYPNGVFHSCNNVMGMHWKDNATSWTLAGATTLELYFR